MRRCGGRYFEKIWMSRISLEFTFIFQWKIDNLMLIHLVFFSNCVQWGSRQRKKTNVCRHQFCMREEMDAWKMGAGGEGCLYAKSMGLLVSVRAMVVCFNQWIHIVRKSKRAKQQRSPTHNRRCVYVMRADATSLIGVYSEPSLEALLSRFSRLHFVCF